MPLIHSFKSTNIWNAFILNSIASTLIIFIAMTVRQQYDIYTDNKHNIISSETNIKSVILTLSATFVTTVCAYIVMYIVFGFGGGMIIN